MEDKQSSLMGYLKKHPYISGTAATIGLGTIAYYSYRNYLVSCYKQALLKQQKESKEIKNIQGGSLYPVAHGVAAIATDHSNNYLLCGLSNGALQLRDFETLELYQETERFKDDRSNGYNIRAVAMHPSKSICAVAYYDYGSHLYHEVIGIYTISSDKTLTCQKILYGPSRSVTGLAFNKDGSLLASISDREGSNKLLPAQDTVQIWDTNDWACVKKFNGHTNDGLKVSFSADGKLLASSGYEEAKIWDISTEDCIKTFNDTIGYRISSGKNYGNNNIFIAAFHPTMPNLLAVGDKKKVKLIDIENDHVIQEFQDSTSFDYLPSDIAFDKKGKKIAVRYEDNEIYKNSYLSWYETKSGKQLGHAKVNDNCGFWGNVIFDKDSNNIISGFNMTEKFYERYIENPISATILEKLGTPIFRYDNNQSYGRIGKFPCAKTK